MSSFAISKKEYVKVSGYIAGIADSASIGVHDFWVFDYKACKNTDADLYYKRFVQCYEMNAISVQKQYKDATPETDSNEYMTEFKQYYKKGYSLICESADIQRQAVSEIQNFFHSSLYQTEDEKYNFMMKHFYMTILDQLVERILLPGYKADSWGTFEAPESSRNITRIA